MLLANELKLLYAFLGLLRDVRRQRHTIDEQKFRISSLEQSLEEMDAQLQAEKEARLEAERTLQTLVERETTDEEFEEEEEFQDEEEMDIGGEIDMDDNTLTSADAAAALEHMLRCEQLEHEVKNLNRYIQQLRADNIQYSNTISSSLNFASNEDIEDFVRNTNTLQSEEEVNTRLQSIANTPPTSGVMVCIVCHDHTRMATIYFPCCKSLICSECLHNLRKEGKKCLNICQGKDKGKSTGNGASGSRDKGDEYIDLSKSSNDVYRFGSK